MWNEWKSFTMKMKTNINFPLSIRIKVEINSLGGGNKLGKFTEITCSPFYYLCWECAAEARVAHTHHGRLCLLLACGRLAPVKWRNFFSSFYLSRLMTMWVMRLRRRWRWKYYELLEFPYDSFTFSHSWVWRTAAINKKEKNTKFIVQSTKNSFINMVCYLSSYDAPRPVP